MTPNYDFCKAVFHHSQIWAVREEQLEPLVLVLSARQVGTPSSVANLN